MISTVLETYSRAPLSFVKGEGCWLVDESGRRFLDMGAGIAVNILGHAHPDLVRALQKQSSLLWHTSNLYNIPNQQALADCLVEHTFGDTVFFTNSGTEAMECAVKMARKFHYENGKPERHNIITFEGSFHGRSLGMISAAGSEKLTKGFEPLLPGFVHTKFDDLDGVLKLIDENTAAILLEPIQGEGGIFSASDMFLKGLREACDIHGILLIFDEIQCGMGRSGKLFMHEWAGVFPDIMAIAKGIGGGFPLGACIATEHAAKGMTVGSHGSTYGGNPLACAVGLEVMKQIANDDFLNSVRSKASLFSQKIEALIIRHPMIFDEFRGAGLMLGIKCKITNIDVVNMGYEHEILTIPGGDNVIRLLPALNISEDEINESILRLDRVANTLEEKL